MLSIIIDYCVNHLDFVISVGVSVVFLLVNIIQAIKTASISKLKVALQELPQVIRDVEDLFVNKRTSSTEKKACAISLCDMRFGRVYRKNIKMFDDAIEDILNTPKKKGGSVDVSKES